MGVVVCSKSQLVDGDVLLGEIRVFATSHLIPPESQAITKKDGLKPGILQNDQHIDFKAS